MLSTSFNSLSRVQSSGILKITANFNHTCLVSPISSRPPLRKQLPSTKERVCRYLGQRAFLLSAVFAYCVIVFAFCKNDKWRHAGLGQDSSALGQQQRPGGAEWWEEGTKCGPPHIQLEALLLRGWPSCLSWLLPEELKGDTKGPKAEEQWSPVCTTKSIFITSPPWITEWWVCSSAEKPNSQARMFKVI